jgi:hypothetical protein
MNLTLTGQVLIVNLIIITYMTLKYAKGNTNNLPLVGFYSVLLNVILFPAGWYYCWRWSEK